MSETNAEVQHYQAVVDDLRVANERLAEEVHQLRLIAGLAGRYIASVDGRNNVEPHHAFDDLNNAVQAYLESKGGHS